MRALINGNEAIVAGALDAGCDFFAGYPITPATSILLRMVDELPRRGGIAIQGEDEIASLGFCIGAALSGRRVMTATSGPGIALYAEQIGLAVMAEVPLVIVDVQRLGPSTGGATTVGQGDVQMVRWLVSGGYPVIVLAPATVADCYSLTRWAFDLATRFRCPVFVLTDKEVALTLDTIDVEDLQGGRGWPAVNAGMAIGDAEAIGAVASLWPFGGEELVRFTGSTHDAAGYLTKDPSSVRRLNEHLGAKVDAFAVGLELARREGAGRADVLIVSYGVTARAMEEALEILERRGVRGAALTLLSLWPVPEALLRREAEGVRTVVVAELNRGLYRREVERVLGSERVVGVHKVDGTLIAPEELAEAVLREVERW